MTSLFKMQFRAGLLLASLATASFASAAHAAKTVYPLTLQNCGRPIAINKAPTKTVSIGQSSTEILYLLGLVDKVAGTAL